MIALVTGGSSGIGKMIASGLISNGAKVYIAARKERQLKEVRSWSIYIATTLTSACHATQATDELNKVGPGSCHYIVADLSVCLAIFCLVYMLTSRNNQNKTGCDALVAEFKKRESVLHILVNNSGTSWGAPWDNVPEWEGWDRVMALNVKSIFYSKLCSSLLSVLRTSRILQ